MFNAEIQDRVAINGIDLDAIEEVED